MKVIQLWAANEEIEANKRTNTVLKLQQHKTTHIKKGRIKLKYARWIDRSEHYSYPEKNTYFSAGTFFLTSYFIFLEPILGVDKIQVR